MTPLLLAVDTTHEHGSLALARGTEVLEQLPVHAPDGFAHVIYGCLEELLKRHSTRLDEIDCFGVASGPGSFTGVRIGLACVKGLAEATGKPAVGISNLEAIAMFGSAPLRAVVLDARRDEVYAAVYDEGGRLILPETVIAFGTWLAKLPDQDLEFISPDFTVFCEQFAGTRFENARLLVAPHTLAGAIARIAYRRFLNGEASDPAALDANYVRRSDAELLWKE